jgi:hypothetical protein
MRELDGLVHIDYMVISEEKQDLALSGEMRNSSSKPCMS